MTKRLKTGLILTTILCTSCASLEEPVPDAQIFVIKEAAVEGYNLRDFDYGPEGMRRKPDATPIRKENQDLKGWVAMPPGDWRQVRKALEKWLSRHYTP